MGFLTLDILQRYGFAQTCRRTGGVYWTCCITLVFGTFVLYNSRVTSLSVTMRFLHIWSFRFCFIGLFLFSAPAAFGQGTHGFRWMSVLEDATEDEREERELQTRRQRIEQITDSVQQQMEMELLQRDEANRQNRLARRQRDEVGADLFYFPRLKEQLLQEGWCQLFDGHTDFGWKVQTEGPHGGGKFTFGQGEIVNDPLHPGMVYTEIPFGDIHLRFDYWAEKDSEVLLLLKTPSNPGDLEKSCYTFVLNSSQSNRPRGLLLGRHELSIADLRAVRELWDNPTNTEEGSWHSVQVKTEGNDIQFWMDRRPATSYFDRESIRTGHVGFLVTKGRVRFQNILWRPSLSVSIFDTDNIIPGTPWQVLEGGEFTGNASSAFRLLTGSVESKEVYKDYILQMQYIQRNNSGRSSLFVRSLPGRVDTGYEISLQNFPLRKDRETAVGVDAGGFLNIKNARYIRAQDRQWTYLTVAAMGRQIQTWVNGVPVCSIHDRRTVRESVPTDRQRDPFLGPGTIRFSVPPENTEFQFRHLTVSPIP